MFEVPSNTKNIPEPSLSSPIDKKLSEFKHYFSVFVVDFEVDFSLGSSRVFLWRVPSLLKLPRLVAIRRKKFSSTHPLLAGSLWHEYYRFVQM